MRIILWATEGAALVGLGLLGVWSLHPSRYILEMGQRPLWDYQARAVQLAEISHKTRPEAVYIGDSQIVRFPVSPEAGNYGISGDTVDGVLMRVPGLDLTRSKAIVLEVGINNWHRDRMAGFGAKYRGLLASLPPAAAVIATAILPLGDAASRYFPLAAARTSVREANKAVQAACSARPGCRFMDLAPALADASGALKPEYTSDGLHLTPAAYAIWAARVAAQ